MNVALKAAAWAWRFKRQKTTPRYILHGGVSTPRYLGLFWIFSGSSFATPGYIWHRGVLTPRYIGSWGVSTLRYLGHQGVSTLRYLGLFWIFSDFQFCDSPVLRTPGSFDSLVHGTPGSLHSPVHRTPGSHFKMLTTQPRSKKNQNGPRTCWDQEDLFGGKNWVQKISWDCPFKSIK